MKGVDLTGAHSPHPSSFKATVKFHLPWKNEIYCNSAVLNMILSSLQRTPPHLPLIPPLSISLPIEPLDYNVKNRISYQNSHDLA